MATSDHVTTPTTQAIQMRLVCCAPNCREPILKLHVSGEAHITALKCPKCGESSYFHWSAKGVDAFLIEKKRV